MEKNDLLYLHRNSAIVAMWPEWKRGSPPNECEDVYIAYAVCRLLSEITSNLRKYISLFPSGPLNDLLCELIIAEIRIDLARQRSNIND